MELWLVTLLGGWWHAPWLNLDRWLRPLPHHLSAFCQPMLVASAWPMHFRVWRGQPHVRGVCCQLAVDTIVHCIAMGLLTGAVDADGAASGSATQGERTYPELVGPRIRARLVVLAVEVGGRWLSQTRSRVEPKLFRRRAEQAWRMRVRPEMRLRSGWRHSSQF